MPVSSNGLETPHFAALPPLPSPLDVPSRPTAAQMLSVEAGPLSTTSNSGALGKSLQCHGDCCDICVIYSQNGLLADAQRSPEKFTFIDPAVSQFDMLIPGPGPAVAAAFSSMQRCRRRQCTRN